MRVGTVPPASQIRQVARRSLPLSTHFCDRSSVKIRSTLGGPEMPASACRAPGAGVNEGGVGASWRRPPTRAGAARPPRTGAQADASSRTTAAARGRIGAGLQGWEGGKKTRTGVSGRDNAAPAGSGERRASRPRVLPLRSRRGQRAWAARRGAAAAAAAKRQELAGAGASTWQPQETPPSAAAAAAATLERSAGGTGRGRRGRARGLARGKGGEK